MSSEPAGRFEGLEAECSAPAVVELAAVHVAYRGSAGRRGFALDVPRLTVAAGERVACIGPSGTGKTTLVNVLCGWLAPARGRVTVLGSDLTALGERERRRFRLRRLGLVFQDLALVDYLSARDNIRLATWLDAHVARRFDRRAALRRADALGRALGLGPELDRRPARLSHGERQRVALARALFTRPALLLCDEATGHLDPDTAQHTLELLFAALAEHGASVFFVTHDHALLPRFERTIDTRAFVRSTRPDTPSEPRAEAGP